LALVGPTVIDADGLVAFEGCAERIAERRSPSVLTPHPGEAGRLVGSFDGKDPVARREAAARKSKSCSAVVVLKGHATITIEDERTAENATGNPGMATAGAGDVLSGIIGGLLAQGISPFEAAALGAHVHGLAGDIAASVVGQTALVAGDILRRLPDAFSRLEGSTLADGRDDRG
jgi:NAD(P)H-hydrate epimerase